MSNPLRIAIAFFCAALSHGQAIANDSSAIHKIKLSPKESTLIFEDFSGTKIDLKPFSGANSIEQAKILSLVTSPSDNRLNYLVLQVDGPTTSGHGSGQCGAGFETNLVWLKVYAPAIVDSQSILIGSCAYNIEAAEMPTSKKIAVTYGSYGEKREYVLSYDEKEPMIGFKITSQPMDTVK